MKNPVYDQIQARKVNVTMRMLKHAHRVRQSILRTCPFFRLSRSLRTSCLRARLPVNEFTNSPSKSVKDLLD
jgi:hypothetical protein